MFNNEHTASWISALFAPALTFYAWARRKSLHGRLDRVEKKLDDLILGLATK